MMNRKLFSLHNHADLEKSNSAEWGFFSLSSSHFFTYFATTFVPLFSACLSSSSCSFSLIFLLALKTTKQNIAQKRLRSRGSLALANIFLFYCGRARKIREKGGRHKWVVVQASWEGAWRPFLCVSLLVETKTLTKTADRKMKRS